MNELGESKRLLVKRRRKLEALSTNSREATGKNDRHSPLKETAQQWNYVQGKSLQSKLNELEAKLEELQGRWADIESGVKNSAEADERYVQRLGALLQEEEKMCAVLRMEIQLLYL